jgi:hypothetical protein
LGPNTCFLIYLVMSFAVQLASDFVSTPYVVRQGQGIKVTPLPLPVMMICVMLISRMNSMFVSTVNIVSPANCHQIETRAVGILVTLVRFHCVDPHVIYLHRKQELTIYLLF